MPDMTSAYWHFESMKARTDMTDQEAAKAARESAGKLAVEAAGQMTAGARIDAIAAALAPKVITDPKSPIEAIAATAPQSYDPRLGKLVTNLRAKANKLDAGSVISAKLDVSNEPEVFTDVMGKIEQGLATRVPIRDYDTLQLESTRFSPLSINGLLESKVIAMPPTRDAMRKHALASSAPVTTFKLEDNFTDIVFIQTSQPGVLAEVVLEPSVKDGWVYAIPTEVGVSLSPLEHPQ